MLRLFTQGPCDEGQDRLQRWTLEEMAVFDAALAQHGKDFPQVAQNVMVASSYFMHLASQYIYMVLINIDFFEVNLKPLALEEMLVEFSTFDY